MASMKKLEVLKIIGQNIKRIRLEKGLTQVDLVGKIRARIDTTNISRIEKGRTNATIHTLFKISQALEVPLSKICNMDDENKLNWQKANLASISLLLFPQLRQAIQLSTVFELAKGLEIHPRELFNFELDPHS